jgi:hypothetical protein
MREQGMFDAARLVFIDGTSANTKMMRLHGRCARGERLVDQALEDDHARGCSASAWMRASQTIDGAMTGKEVLGLCP